METSEVSLSEQLVNRTSSFREEKKIKSVILSSGFPSESSQKNGSKVNPKPTVDVMMIIKAFMPNSDRIAFYISLFFHVALGIFSNLVFLSFWLLIDEYFIHSREFKLFGLNSIYVFIASSFLVSIIYTIPTLINYILDRKISYLFQSKLMKLIMINDLSWFYFQSRSDLDKSSSITSINNESRNTHISQNVNNSNISGLSSQKAITFDQSNLTLETNNLSSMSNEERIKFPNIKNGESENVILSENIILSKGQLYPNHHIAEYLKNNYSNIQILSSFGKLFFYYSSIVSILIIIFLFSYQLGIVVFIGFALQHFMLHLLLRLANKEEDLEGIPNKKAYDVVDEYLNNIRESKALGNMNFLYSRFTSNLHMLSDIACCSNKSKSRKSKGTRPIIPSDSESHYSYELSYLGIAMLTALTKSLQYLIILGMTYYGYQLKNNKANVGFINQELTCSDIVVITILSAFGAYSLMSIVKEEKSTASFIKNQACNIVELIGEIPEVKKIGLMTKPNKELIKSSIKFEGITFKDFTYSISNHSAPPILLNNANFTIENNEKVCIVGDSSISFIIPNLITRVIKYNTGEIYLDNIKIKDIEGEHLKSLISVIDGKSVIFENRSIKDNILFGRLHLLTKLIEDKSNNQFDLDSKDEKRSFVSFDRDRNQAYNEDSYIVDVCKRTKLWSLMTTYNIENIDYIITDTDLESNFSPLFKVLINITRSILLNPNVLVVVNPNELIYEICRDSQKYLQILEEESQSNRKKTDNLLSPENNYCCNERLNLTRTMIENQIAEFDSILFEITKNVTTILITDDLRYVTESFSKANDDSQDRLICNRLLIFEAGSLKYTGSFQELKDQNHSSFLKKIVLPNLMKNTEILKYYEGKGSKSRHSSFVSNMITSRRKEAPKYFEDQIIKSVIENKEKNLALKKCCSAFYSQMFTIYSSFYYKEFLEGFRLRTSKYIKNSEEHELIEKFYEHCNDSLLEITDLKFKNVRRWGTIASILIVVDYVVMSFLIGILMKESYYTDNPKVLKLSLIIWSLVLLQTLLYLFKVYLSRRLSTGLKEELQKRLFKTCLGQEHEYFQNLNDSEFKIPSLHETYPSKRFDSKNLNYLKLVIFKYTSLAKHFSEFRLEIYEVSTFLFLSILLLISYRPLLGMITIGFYITFLLSSKLINFIMAKHESIRGKHQKSGAALLSKALDNINYLCYFNYNLSICKDYNILLNHSDSLKIILSSFVSFLNILLFLLLLILIPISLLFYKKLMIIDSFGDNKTHSIINFASRECLSAYASFLITIFGYHSIKLTNLFSNFRSIKKKILQVFLILESKRLMKERQSIRQDEHFKSVSVSVDEEGRSHIKSILNDATPGYKGKLSTESGVAIPILEFNSICLPSFKYQNFQLIPPKYLNNFSLKVEGSQIVVFTGMTEVEIMLNLLDKEWNHRSVSVGSQSVFEADERTYKNMTSLVTARSFIYSGMSLKENIFAHASQKMKANIDTNFQKIINICDLIHMVDYSKPLLDSELCGQDIAKISVARSIAKDSRYLFIDDISIQIDDIKVCTILNYLESDIFKSTPRLVVIGTKNIKLIQKSDKVYFFDEYKLKEQGTMLEMINDKRLFYYFMISNDS